MSDRMREILGWNRDERIGVASPTSRHLRFVSPSALWKAAPAWHEYTDVVIHVRLLKTEPESDRE